MSEHHKMRFDKIWQHCCLIFVLFIENIKREVVLLKREDKKNQILLSNFCPPP